MVLNYRSLKNCFPYSTVLDRDEHDPALISEVIDLIDGTIKNIVGTNETKNTW